MYAIYDTKDYEQCVGIFDKQEEVAEYFNTTTNCIKSTISRKSKIKGRYLIERINNNVPSERIEDILQKIEESKEIQKVKTELILKETREREEQREFEKKKRKARRY